MGLIWLLFFIEHMFVSWCEVNCGSKYRHQKHMCLKEIEACAQMCYITLGSSQHNWGPQGNFDH